MRHRTIAAVAAGAFVWFLISVAGGWVPVREVSASGSWDKEHAPQRASDRLTQETPNGSASWLLPDGKTGEIRFTFDGSLGDCRASRAADPASRRAVPA